MWNNTVTFRNIQLTAPLITSASLLWYVDAAAILVRETQPCKQIHVCGRQALWWLKSHNIHISQLISVSLLYMLRFIMKLGGVENVLSPITLNLNRRAIITAKCSSGVWEVYRYRLTSVVENYFGLTCWNPHLLSMNLVYFPGLIIDITNSLLYNLMYTKCAKKCFASRKLKTFLFLLYFTLYCISHCLHCRHFVKLPRHFMYIDLY